MEYSEMQSFLDKENTTAEEMQMMWDYCVRKKHRLISQLDKGGTKWTDLNIYALGTLKREYLRLKEVE